MHCNKSLTLSNKPFASVFFSHKFWFLHRPDANDNISTETVLMRVHVTRGGGGDSVLKGLGCLPYLLGAKKVFLVLLRDCSASKGPQQELLQYLLGYWAEKLWQEIMCCFRISTCTSWKEGGEKFSGHTYKARSWCLLWVISKFATSNPVHLIRGAPGVNS